MKLKKLQQQFSDALLYKNDLITSQIKEKASFSKNELLQVYRNSFVMGVTEALTATYQHTHSLVGEEFFNAVARAFILQYPPQENNIINYGKGFSDFLQTFEQLQGLPYIAEMARFEWLLEKTSEAALQTETLSIEKLSTLSTEQFENIIFQVPSQLSLFSSKQNIQLLYQMIIDQQVQETDLNSPCYLALIKQTDFSVELVSLKREEFLLAEQIVKQQPLGEIAPDDLHPFLPELLKKQLLSGFTIKENL